MKKIIITLMVSMFFAGTASAALITPQVSPEVSIWSIYNQLYPGQTATQLNIGTYENDVAIANGLYSQVGTGLVPWVARYAGDRSMLYTYTPGSAGSTIPMSFSPALPGGNFIDPTRHYLAGIPTGTPTIFGFSLLDTTTGERWYTQKGLNNPADNRYHFLVLNAPTANTLLVGVEDRSTGDWDYNDFVFEFKNIKAINPVPEPATMVLFGMGLAGLGVLRRRQS